MRLYHYTSAEIKDKIKVKHYGVNSYSDNDVKATNIKRSFWYSKPIIAECHLKDSKYYYIANVTKGSIYNLKTDRLKLKSRHNTISALLKNIKRRGYKGILYYLGYDIVNLFYDVEYNKRKILC